MPRHQRHLHTKHRSANTCTLVKAALTAAGCIAITAMAAPANAQCEWTWQTGLERAGAIVGGIAWDAVVHDDGSGPAMFVCTDSGRIQKFDGTSWREIGRVYGNATGVAGGSTYKLAVLDPDGDGPSALNSSSPAASEESRTEHHRRHRLGRRAMGRQRLAQRAPTELGNGLYFIRAMTTYNNDGTGPKLVIANENFPFNAGIIIREHSGAWQQLDPNLFSTAPELSALHAFDDGDGEALYVGGLFQSFSTINGNIVSPGVIKWNGSSWEPPGRVSNTPPAKADASTASQASTTATDQALCRRKHRKLRRRHLRQRTRQVDRRGMGGRARPRLPTRQFGPYVRTLQLDDGPALFLSGRLANMTTQGLARWTGTGWDGLNWDAAQNGQPFALCADPDGPGPTPALVHAPVSSTFQYDGVSEWTIPPILPNSQGIKASANLFWIDTDADGPQAPGLLALSNSSATITTQGDVSIGRIARFDGTQWATAYDGLSGLEIRDTEFTTGGAPVCAITHDDGTGPALYVAGQFTHNNNEEANRILRYTTNGWKRRRRHRHHHQRTPKSLDDGRVPGRPLRHRTVQHRRRHHRHQHRTVGRNRMARRRRRRRRRLQLRTRSRRP